MKIYGLIGRSLGHSFSEKYFAEKFKKENIRDCQYRNLELKDLGNEIPELKKKPDLAGLNVTIPYKTEILSFLDEISAEVSEINACNCIKIKDEKWKGYNTDIIGFEKSFVPYLKPFHKKALVLGTGGASKAVVFVLKRLGIDFLKVSRNKNESASIISYEDISAALFKEFQIVINTTPVGTFPNVDEMPPLPYELINSQHYFFDLIYNPSKTQFLSLAEKKGAVIENGSKMLALQAEESWKIWNS
ncbi:MAG: shikimate dehydrogenase [Bacteroidota bacterium]|nr:shikimate dehydrogenase [Bacteroidota bacterium]